MNEARPLSASEIRDRTGVIFGGAGFIGTHLARHLSQLGANVIIADTAAPSTDLPPGVRFIYCDVREPIALDVSGEPLVFNLAAIHRTPGHAAHEYFDTNIQGATNVIDFCIRHGVTNLWFTSSIAIYGPTEQACVESSPPRPTSAYGQSKLEAEGIHRAWLKGSPGDRRLVIVRPAAVFGPGEKGNFTRLAAALRRGFFFYPGRRDTLKACGYIDDLVMSLLFMWAAAEPLVIYNFGYPEPPTLESICRAFHEVGGLPAPRGTIPTAPMLGVARGLSRLGFRTFDPDRVRKLVASTNIEPRELVARGFTYETDLRGAIARWRAADPEGQFV